MAKRPKRPKRFPKPNALHERRIVLFWTDGLPTIIGLSYLPTPPAEISLRRAGSEEIVTCTLLGYNDRAILYRDQQPVVVPEEPPSSAPIV